jgi:acyl-CoA reductase-like NAD-dependent aldehyde dehydrogenase
MRIPASPYRATQLALFQLSPGGPRWEQLPGEVRQQTVRLLARMLNEHAARRLASLLTQEVGDE